MNKKSYSRVIILFFCLATLIFAGYSLLQQQEGVPSKEKSKYCQKFEVVKVNECSNGDKKVVVKFKKLGKKLLLKVSCNFDFSRGETVWSYELEPYIITETKDFIDTEEGPDFEIK